MARLFYASVLAGIVLTILAAIVYPLPSHERYRSSIAVIPDGGREESFTIRWPQDRVQPLSDVAASAPVAAGGIALLEQAGAPVASVEVFKLRDMAGNVVGIASRGTGPAGAVGQRTDWILLLPSRGALYMSQVNGRDAAPRPHAAAGGARYVAAPDAPDFWGDAKRLRITAGPAPGGTGEVLGGTEEFAGLKGSYDEDWDLEEQAPDGSTRGHVTLVTRIGAASQ